jgi:hypothetical protein
MAIVALQLLPLLQLLLAGRSGAAGAAAAPGPGPANVLPCMPQSPWQMWTTGPSSELQMGVPCPQGDGGRCCLDAVDGGVAWVQPCAGTSTQQWVRQADGSIQNKATGQCIGVGQCCDAGPVLLYNCAAHAEVSCCNQASQQGRNKRNGRNHRLTLFLSRAQTARGCRTVPQSMPKSPGCASTPEHRRCPCAVTHHWRFATRLCRRLSAPPT